MSNIYYLFSIYDRLFTDVSHAFKKNNDFNSFYGLAYAKTRVLKDKIYSHISYIPDLIMNADKNIDYDFLKNIENQYQVTIAQMIHSDRHLLRYNKDQRLAIAQTLIKKVIEELHHYKISMVFSESIDDFISFFTSLYCKHHCIKFVYIATAGLGDSLFLTDRLDAGPINLEQQFENAKNILSEDQEAAAVIRKQVEEYISQKRQPYYVSQGELLYKPYHKRDLKRLYQYIRNYYSDTSGFHFDKNPFALPFYRLKRIIYKNRYKAFINDKKIGLEQLKGKNYLIYPLHFHPESATLIRGRWFNNQLAIIEMLSKNLPVNMFLVVKEHKVSVGRRHLDFYKQFEKHHNVLVVDDEMPVYDLIGYSKGVATISSTMAVEALLLKKPVILFGERYYNVSSNVYLVKDYCQIGEIINTMLSNQFNELSMLSLFYLIQKNKKEIESVSATEYSDQDVSQIAHHVNQYYHEK